LPEIAAKILVVCTGNTCRSPLAAAMLRTALARALDIGPSRLLERGLDVSSAGTSAFSGDPASGGSLRAAERRGLSLEHHASRSIAEVDLGDYECVFGLTPEHVSTLKRRFGVEPCNHPRPGRTRDRGPVRWRRRRLRSGRARYRRRGLPTRTAAHPARASEVSAASVRRPSAKRAAGRRDQAPSGATRRGPAKKNSELERAVGEGKESRAARVLIAQPSHRAGFEDRAAKLYINNAPTRNVEKLFRASLVRLSP
jgi:protein-tyrosine-phosphatase